MAEPDVGQVWEGVAEAWEHHEQRLAEHLAPVRERLLTHLDPQPGQRILELAAGTGALSCAIAVATGPDGDVLCTDVAPGMVDAARRQAREAGLDNVRCTVMDAHDIDLPADAVDGVACAFGFMLMPDPARALSETRRVLRDGGRLALSTWGAPEHNPWLVVIAGSLLQHGHLAQADPMGPVGVFSLSDRETLASLLTDAGFDDIAVQAVDLIQRFDSATDYWEFHAATGGPIAAALDELDHDEIARIRATCEELCHGYRADGDGYAFPGRALIARGI